MLKMTYPARYIEQPTLGATLVRFPDVHGRIYAPNNRDTAMPEV